MSFINSLFVRMFCKEVGVDPFGNRYFEGSLVDYSGKKKRYVVYKGIVEPSKVPPMWHGWLHYLCDELPTNNQPAFEWQQDHIPNLTGTKSSYHPKKGEARGKVASDYARWQPKE